MRSNNARSPWTTRSDDACGGVVGDEGGATGGKVAIENDGGAIDDGDVDDDAGVCRPTGSNREPGAPTCALVAPVSGGSLAALGACADADGSADVGEPADAEQTGVAEHTGVAEVRVDAVAGVRGDEDAIGAEDAVGAEEARKERMMRGGSEPWCAARREAAATRRSNMRSSALLWRSLRCQAGSGAVS